MNVRLGWAGAVVLVAVSPLCADVTTWTNPAGGSWSDPANWSNGVPAAADTVVLPPLDADGYSIAMPASASVGSLEVGGAVAGGAIVLSGGSLLVAQSTEVGANGAVGLLHLDGSVLQTAALLVGSGGGTGEIRVRNGGIAAANTLSSGDGGSGTIDVASSSKLLASGASFSSGSTLRIEVAPAAGSPVLVDALTRGGKLEVIAGPGIGLPNPELDVLTSWAPMSGTFSEMTGPIVDGLELILSSNQLWIKVPPSDPVVSLDAFLQHEPIYAGFRYAIDLVMHHASGAEETYCPSGDCDVVFTVEGSSASVIYDSWHYLIVPSTEPFVLTASYVGQPTPVSAVRAIAPSDDYPRTYDRVTASADGTPANEPVCWLAGPFFQWTPDARYVVFISAATNLVSNPPPSPGLNVYLKDRATGLVELISTGAGAPDPAAWCSTPDLSSDGRFVVFGTGSGSTARQIWLRDRWLGTTRLVSHGADGSAADGSCLMPQISLDGTTVVFSSSATNLVPGAPAGGQIYVYDVASDTVSAVSVLADGQFANGSCTVPQVSADGATVVFRTVATNLVPDNAGTARLVRWQRKSGEFDRVDVSTLGEGGNLNVGTPAMTPSGRYVAFDSTSDNLGCTPDGNGRDILVRDLETGTTTCLSDFTVSPPAHNYPMPPVAISDDGAYVAFFNDSVSLYNFDHARRVHVPTLTHDWAVPDMWDGSVFAIEEQIALSADGQAVLFYSADQYVVPFGGAYDCSIFVYDRRSFAAADLNHDGFVNGADLALQLGAWGTSGPGDLDGNGVVGAGDLAFLLGAWTG